MHVRRPDLTVLMNAGPWLPVPPRGYGGIEAIVATLTDALRQRGVRIVLATVGASTQPSERRVSVFDQGQFEQIGARYNATVGIAHAHMQAVTDEIASNREIDLVHDHLEVVGPGVLGALGSSGPPVLQTLHWDLRKHPHFYDGFDGKGRVWFAGVSESQIDSAPARLREQILEAIPLGVPLDAYVPATPAHRSDYILSLARVTEDKGQDIAARVCRDRGLELVMAGPVAGLADPDQLRRALERPDGGAREHRDVAFYLERVRPLQSSRRRWIGSVSGARKRELLAGARALLCPLRWEEPGGTAVIEALASGTPVVGLRRGCLPSLVDDGVTGFLADGEEELGDCLERLEELDSAACRRAVVQRFSADVMADRYLDLYRRVLERLP